MASKLTIDEENIKALAELAVDPQTTEHLRVKIITKLCETKEGEHFFKAMFDEKLSYGECPCCGHKNHWGIPEDSLNQYGWVSSQKDDRVPKTPTAKDCPEFQQACLKKKVTI